MVRNKQFLALANTLTNFKLKDFADHFGVSYGVVRLWNREEAVKKRANELRLVFAWDYVSKIEELLSHDAEESYESFKDRLAYQNSLFQEARNYSSDIQWMIYKLMEDKTKTKEHALLWWATFLAFITALHKEDIFYPPKQPKLKKDFERKTVLLHKIRTKLIKSLFADLKKSIESNNPNQALFITNSLMDTMLGDMEENTILRLSVINKGKRRGRKDIEKLYAAGKSQTT